MNHRFICGKNIFLLDRRNSDSRFLKLSIYYFHKNDLVKFARFGYRPSSEKNQIRMKSDEFSKSNPFFALTLVIKLQLGAFCYLFTLLEKFHI